MGHKVTVHLGEKLLEVYDDQQTLVCSHVLLTKKGQWSTRNEHYPVYKSQYIQNTPDVCCKSARRIGPATHAVVQQLLSDKPLHRLRSVQAILKLEETVGEKRLEAACKRALFYGDIQYRRIKDILNAALDQEPLPTNHPVSESQAHRFARNVMEFFHPSENSLQ